MAIVHVVLHKSNDSTSPEFVAEWAKRGEAMKGTSLLRTNYREIKVKAFSVRPGKIPGLSEIKLGTVMEGSKHKSAGYTHMLYSVFEDEKTLRDYATHPVHEELVAYGKGKWASGPGDKIVFDLEL